MLGNPRSGCKIWETLDREIGKPGENRGQVVADWEFLPQCGASIGQALLRALEGNATDCATSILPRISSSGGLAPS